MRLYFNGCSVTYGDDLPAETRENTVWPALVAKHYNCDFFNDAMSGGTNGRIVSHVLNHINQFDKFYIQWTYASRFTLTDSTNWYEVNFNEGLKHTMYKNFPYFSIFGKYYYTYWYHSLFGFKKWLEEIILLQTLFKYHNKPYLMVSSVHNHYNVYSASRDKFISMLSTIMDIENFSDDIILDQHTHIQNLLYLIDFKYFIPPTDFGVVDNIAPLYRLGPTGHLLEEGNRAVADYIINYETILSSKKRN
jgi:hypothetical protein